MPKNIIDGKVSTEEIARIGESDVSRLAQHRLKKGDIVYGRRGDIGRRGLITEREDGWLCGTGCLRISLGNSVLNPVFLYYYLGQPQVISWIYNKAIGATMPNLNTEIIRSVPISHPPLPTQRKIAAILSAYDDLIENNTRRIKILDEMAQALYREWFVKFRFPGHENVKMVESEIGMVLEGWEVKKLGDLVTIHRGKSYRSVDIVEEVALPFLNLKCVERGGGFRYDGVKRFQGEYKNTQTAKTGDIVVAVTDMTQERRLVAHAARVHVIGNDFAVMSMDLVKVEPKAEVSKDYLHGLLRFSDFSQEVRQHANGVNVLHLNTSQIQEFKFALPPTELRNRYAELCSSAYRECDVFHAKNANLRRTRDLLLPKLISGEVDMEKIKIRMPENGGA
jgi:type I restriction enzyme S subunit